MSQQDIERIREIQRVFGCLKTDYFAILSLPPSFTEEDIKRQYKTLSLLLHPDKAPEGYGDRAKIAFSVLNAAREGLDTPEKIKSLQELVEKAADEVKTQRSKEYTELKRQEGKKQNLPNWSSLIVTPDDITKFEQYQLWVNNKVKSVISAEDWRKQQLLKKRQNDINELREEEEAELRTQAVIQKTDDELTKTFDERANNWKNFTLKKGGRYSAARFKSNVGLIDQSQTLTQQFKEVDDKSTTFLLHENNKSTLG